jgi:hypothetical protein
MVAAVRYLLEAPNSNRKALEATNQHPPKARIAGDEQVFTVEKASYDDEKDAYLY